MAFVPPPGSTRRRPFYDGENTCGHQPDARSGVWRRTEHFDGHPEQLDNHPLFNIDNHGIIPLTRREVRTVCLQKVRKLIICRLDMKR
jgi:hypothetical protein